MKIIRFGLLCLLTAFNVLVLTLCSNGCSLKSAFDKPDGPIEELTETIVEDLLEDSLDLPDGSLKDKIDFTPLSKENN